VFRSPLVMMAVLLLLAGSPPRTASSSFLSCLWQQISEMVPPLATGPEPTDGGASPDLGLGMDPNG